MTMMARRGGTGWPPPPWTRPLAPHGATAVASCALAVCLLMHMHSRSGVWVGVRCRCRGVLAGGQQAATALPSLNCTLYVTLRHGLQQVGSAFHDRCSITTASSLCGIAMPRRRAMTTPMSCQRRRSCGSAVGLGILCQQVAHRGHASALNGSGVGVS